MALKTTVLEVLSCMLSEDTGIRKIAEERKKALEMTEDYPVVLMEIILKSEEAVEERQLAASLLKQYIHTNWNKTSHYTPTLYVPDELRALFKRELPRGLSDHDRKIQAAVAVVTAYIAVYDYPYKWPEVSDFTRALLQSRYITQVFGVLQFLIEFSESIDQTQARTLAPKVYNLLSSLIEKEDVFDTHLRSLAIRVFVKLLIVHAIDRDDRHSLVQPVLNKFINQIGEILAQPYSEKSDFALKAECVQGITTMFSQLCRFCQETVKQLLPLIWEILTKCGSEYTQVLAGARELPYDKDEEPSNPVLFNRLLLNIFSLIETIILKKRGFYLLGDQLGNIMYYLTLYMAPSQATEQRWKSEEEIYVRADYTDDRDTELRMAAKDLLLLISKRFDDVVFVNSLTSSLEKQQLCLTKYLEEPASYYWRLLEGMLFAMGTFNEYILDLYGTGKLRNLNIVAHLSQWTSLLDSAVSWPLTGRILWIGGCFSSLLTIEDMIKHVSTCVLNLRQSNHILRVASIRALQLHSSSVQQSVHVQFLHTTLSPIFEGIFVAIAISNNTATDLAMETIANLLPIHTDFNSTVSSRVVSLVAQLFPKHGTRPKFLAHCNAIVKVLSVFPGCDSLLQANFIPLINKLHSQNPNNPHERELQISAMVMLDNLIKYAPKPLSPLLIQVGFVTACKCILKKGNTSINQSGAEVLRSYLIKAPEQIRETTDNENRKLVLYVLEVITYLIDPLNFEMSNHRAGRLIITAMECIGDIITPSIDFILKCAISGLQRTNDFMVEQSLISIFAYLFIHHMEETIAFLTSLPGPSGGNALTFLMQKWMSMNLLEFGKYERNISIVALTRLMHHTIVKVDGRVGFISLDPSSILPLRPNEEQGVQPQISILANMMKFFIHVLDYETRNVQGMPSPRREEASLSISCTDSETSLDSLTLYSPDLEAEAVDPMDEVDPTYNLNVVEYITMFIKEFYQSQNLHFMNLLKLLDDTEVQFLTLHELLQGQ